MTVDEITFLDEEAFKIENDILSVTVVPVFGANIMSIYYKKHQLEILRTPKNRVERDQRPTLYGTPVLFPPNRIDKARFQFDGRSYELEMNRAKENCHIHGFVNDKPWSVKTIELNDNTLILQLNSSDFPHILNQFPHYFVMEMSIQLVENQVIQTLAIKNLSDQTMPLGLGYHTTFHFPIKTSKLEINLGDHWELNDRHMPTGKFTKDPFSDELGKGTSLENKTLDDLYDMSDPEKAVLYHNEQNLKVTYSAGKGFTKWVLFTSDGTQDFLAIEPYTWATNAPNLSLTNEKTGMDALSPGEEKVFQTKLSIDPI